MRSVELPARQVPPTRLAQILVAESRAADSYPLEACASSFEAGVGDGQRGPVGAKNERGYMHNSPGFHRLVRWASLAPLSLAALLLGACGGGASGPSVLVITAGAPPSGATGIAYPGYTFTVASGGAAPFFWSATGALPPGLDLSSAGQLTGTPVNAGTYAFTVQVADTSIPPLTGTLQVSMLIADSGIVVATTPAPPAGIVTNAYPGFTFGVTSGGSPPFTWKVTLGKLPPGLTLSADGSLAGTPTAAGSFAFTATATDSAPTPGTGSAQFNVTINPPAPLAIDRGNTPPAGVHGTTYDGFAFTATGGYLPLRWTVTAGTLPAGLTLNPDGTLSGAPTVASPTPVAFTVTVTDSRAPTAATDSLAIAITISDPLPPTINSPAPPTGTVGVVYPAVQFTASDGLAPLVWIPPTAPMGGLAISLDGILSGTPSAAGIFPITLAVKDALNRTSPATPFTVRVSLARPAAKFTATGGMAFARTGHTATLLNTGKVLVAGGPNNSAELYDPATGLFTATGSMTERRSFHSATLLNNLTLPNYGKVLIVGSTDATAELYDPAAGTFSATGSATILRLGSTATLLNTGKVLLAGGPDATAELYDPAAGTFKATGTMTASRSGHTATLLRDGRVLIAGGTTLPSAELYDPVSGTFNATGSMSEIRSGHTATLLADGTVLLAGTDGTAEQYSPGAGTFAVVGQMLTSESSTTATLRKDTTVLVAGGNNSSFATAELFAPESGGFVATGSLITARNGHTATLLADGTVLIAGGARHFYVCHVRGCSLSTVVLSSAELFK